MEIKLPIKKHLLYSLAIQPIPLFHQLRILVCIIPKQFRAGNGTFKIMPEKNADDVQTIPSSILTNLDT